MVTIHTHHSKLLLCHSCVWISVRWHQPVENLAAAARNDIILSHSDFVRVIRCALVVRMCVRHARNLQAELLVTSKKKKKRNRTELTKRMLEHLMAVPAHRQAFNSNETA